MRILVVEDDEKLRALLGRGLSEEGYSVDAVGTGVDAVWRATEHPYDALVLDLGLPDLDGFAVCRQIRERDCWVPVLMLTARDGVEHRVRGLDVGADDYLVKPFAFEELVARLRALVRRGVVPRPSKLQVGALRLDPAARQVTRDGEPIELTAKEFALLAFLAANRGRVFSRETLLARVWGSRYEGGARTVDIHVRRLRAKLGDALPLETLRGAGYKLRAPSDATKPR